MLQFTSKSMKHKILLVTPYSKKKTTNIITDPILWLEETLFDPPVIPGSLHIGRAVSIRHWAGRIWEQIDKAESW